MMSNMFSIFDPSTMIFSLNWMSLMIPLLILNWSYWLIPSRFNMLLIKLNNYLFNEFLNLTNKMFYPNLIIFISMMTFIMKSNLLSLFPYIFTPTSHLSINLSMSLTLWMTFMLYGWMINTNHMFTHLLPLNTPMLLMNFMILVETISNFIRPWTLAIRLSANMLAGHLLLSLLGSSMNMNFSIILILIQNLLMILELSVSIIQSYVFVVLSLLYYNELFK